MIRLYQDIGKTVENLNGKPCEALTPELFFKHIDNIQDDVDILLDQNGVSAFNEPGDTFNPRRQRALKNTVTQDQNLNGQTSQRIRPGFEYANELLQKELVNLYVYEAPEPDDIPEDLVEEITQSTEIEDNADNCDSVEVTNAVSEQETQVETKVANTPQSSEGEEHVE